VGGQEGYVTLGLYEDGLPGELFIRMAREGSTVLLPHIQLSKHNLVCLSSPSSIAREGVGALHTCRETRRSKANAPQSKELAGRHAKVNRIYRNILKEQVCGDIEAFGQSPNVLGCQIAFTAKDFGNDAGGTEYVH
jgi:hypothetical protein